MNKKKIIRAVTVDQSLGFVEPLLDSLLIKYEVQLLSSPGEKIVSLSNQYNIKRHCINIERHISLINDVKSLFRIIKVFRKEKPYMVHSMTPKAGMLCMLAAWLTRVPRRVHTFTGLVWPTSTGLKRKILMVTDWLTCACATHIIPEGKGVMNDLQSHITNKPMKVLGYGNVRGVDMKRFSRRPEVEEMAKGIKKDGIFTFIFVGRIVGDKGINELVSAFVELHKKYENTGLLLIGNFEQHLDPLKAETLNVIDKHTSIESLGPKYGDELLAYYAASDCFVFPSYREGFPNTVMEAGAMGLPSIVTDINGSREIIIDGKNGVIIPSKDVEALYHAMEEMITNSDKTKEYADNAREMIASRFERGFVCKCLYDFYEEICGINHT
ncbi:MAG: glycosyltransferase family 4 protein [Bacteroidales bacterium]|nr:glycosyltransferase family 4 protein [Bacteroidales bacterium]